jgi:peptide/nickel transport system permease protein
MLRFLARRLALAVPTLILASMIIFALQQLLPGDVATALTGEERDPQVIAFIREKYHLDEPLPVRYAYWASGVLRGDLGESIRLQKPVSELIAEKLPVTLELACLAMLVALAIGVPMACSPRSSAARPPIRSPTAWPSGACRCRISGSGSC